MSGPAGPARPGGGAHPAAYFPGSYTEARSAFLAAAGAAGARLHAYPHPMLRAGDESALSVDVALLGPEAAEQRVALVSGTHGIEGYFGSAVQTGMLREGLHRPAPDGVALVLVHALNPYGFEVRARVNEDNVDLNRNFVDHAAPPANPDYESVHRALVPADWHGPARARADAELGRLLAERGQRWVQTAITYGQWSRPDGLFYGGSRPTWSNDRWRQIAREFLAGAREVAYLDLHTGLGARGAVEPIFRGGRDAGAVDRARRWYGDALTLSEAGTSSSTPITGNTARGLAECLDPGAVLTAVTVECGTVPGVVALAALRADNWLRLQADPDPAEVAAIKHELAEAFSPSDAEWRELVWVRAQAVIAQALAGLAGERGAR